MAEKLLEALLRVIECCIHFGLIQASRISYLYLWRIFLLFAMETDQKYKDQFCIDVFERDVVTTRSFNGNIISCFC